MGRFFAGRGRKRRTSFRWPSASPLGPAGADYPGMAACRYSLPAPRARQASPAGGAGGGRFTGTANGGPAKARLVPRKKLRGEGGWAMEKGRSFTRGVLLGGVGAVQKGGERPGGRHRSAQAIPQAHRPTNLRNFFSGGRARPGLQLRSGKIPWHPGIHREFFQQFPLKPTGKGRGERSPPTFGRGGRSCWDEPGWFRGKGKKNCGKFGGPQPPLGKKKSHL